RAPQRRQAGPYDIFDVLGDYPEAVEADLIRNYPGIGGGDPLGAFFRGEITLRQLRVLVENLPPDCASATRERGHDWTRRDYLAAEIADGSEEHTSELQSRENLVCRLLLEKKKKNTRAQTRA